MIQSLIRSLEWKLIDWNRTISRIETQRLWPLANLFHIGTILTQTVSPYRYWAPADWPTDELHTEPPRCNATISSSHEEEVTFQDFACTCDERYRGKFEVTRWEPRGEGEHDTVGRNYGMDASNSQTWASFPVSFGVSEWASEQKNERSVASKQSEQCKASGWVSDAIEQPTGGANGPVLRASISYVFSTQCHVHECHEWRRVKGRAKIIVDHFIHWLARGHNWRARINGTGKSRFQSIAVASI